MFLVCEFPRETTRDSEDNRGRGGDNLRLAKVSFVRCKCDSLGEKGTGVSGFSSREFNQLLSQ